VLETANFINSKQYILFTKTNKNGLPSNQWNGLYVNWKFRIQTLVLDTVILFSFSLIVKHLKWLSFCLNNPRPISAIPWLFHNFPGCVGTLCKWSCILYMNSKRHQNCKFFIFFFITSHMFPNMNVLYSSSTCLTVDCLQITSYTNTALVQINEKWVLWTHN